MSGLREPITGMFNGIINKSRKNFNINQFKSSEDFSAMFKLIGSEYYHGGTETISTYYTNSFEVEQSRLIIMSYYVLWLNLTIMNLLKNLNE